MQGNRHQHVALFLSFTLTLAMASSARAAYLPLPSSGCPATNEFNLDHYSVVVPLNSCGDSAKNDQSSRIIRGGAPFVSGLNCLKSSGVTIVVDLRKEEEQLDEPSQVVQAGMKYEAFPMTAASNEPGSADCKKEGVGAVRCNEQNALRAVYFIDETLMSDPTAKIYIHCSRGQDRTGLVMGLYRLLKSKCSSVDTRAEMDDFMFTPYKSLLAVWNKYSKK